ncbi:hypothetical protein GCM10009741_25680 [Kribbella lupini]|uniref:Uncharacterized protein n=1 Tax=Kribbella lupini TaxID=291602 RepID=A0ABP4LJ92_9ACTN
MRVGTGDADPGVSDVERDPHPPAHQCASAGGQGESPPEPRTVLPRPLESGAVISEPAARGVRRTGVADPGVAVDDLLIVRPNP